MTATGPEVRPVWPKGSSSVDILFFCRFYIKDTINPSQLLIFTNIIRCSRLPLLIGYFIYFKYTHIFKSLSIAASLVQLKKQIG